MERGFHRRWSKTWPGIKGQVRHGIMRETWVSANKTLLIKWEQDNFHSTWNICLPINQELEPKWQVSKDGLVNPRETWKGVEKNYLRFCQGSRWKGIQWLVN